MAQRMHLLCDYGGAHLHEVWFILNRSTANIHTFFFFLKHAGGKRLQVTQHIIHSRHVFLGVGVNASSHSAADTHFRYESNSKNFQ